MQNCSRMRTPRLSRRLPAILIPRARRFLATWPLVGYKLSWVVLGTRMSPGRSSPGRSSRRRHRNALTERAWKDAVQGLGNQIPSTNMAKGELVTPSPTCLSSSLLWNHGHHENGVWKFSLFCTEPILEWHILDCWLWFLTNVRDTRDGNLALLTEKGKFHPSYRDGTLMPAKCFNVIQSWRIELYNDVPLGL